MQHLNAYYSSVTIFFRFDVLFKSLVHKLFSSYKRTRKQKKIKNSTDEINYGTQKEITAEILQKINMNVTLSAT